MNKKKSIALITVSVIAIMVAILAGAILYVLGAQARAAEHKIRRIRANYAARAGMIDAMECLKHDNCSQPPRNMYPGGCAVSGVGRCKYICDYNIDLNGYRANVVVDEAPAGSTQYCNITVTVNYDPDTP